MHNFLNLWSSYAREGHPKFNYHSRSRWLSGAEATGGGACGVRVAISMITSKPKSPGFGPLTVHFSNKKNPGCRSWQTGFEI